jgi:hypothetical protein
MGRKRHVAFGRFALLSAKMNATHYTDNDGHLAWRSLSGGAIGVERTTRKVMALLTGRLFGAAP